ncbi:MAG: sugar ABC transporter ATP-binding protein [Trueperaceae bacterium]
MTPALLQMQDITKRFGTFDALGGVDFDLQAGEVHALVGENGAGKSTLMKILAGVQPATSGSMSVAGEPVSFTSVADAQAHGVAMVYQELALVAELSVAENLFLGNLPAWVSHRRLAERAAPLLKQVELDVAPLARTGSLAVGEQQLVEIARALGHERRVLVFDEPTAALSSGETERLFHLIALLKERGVGIVYISHRLEEVFEIADRVTVLRDGRKVITAPMSDLTPDDVVHAMVGRDVKRFTRTPTPHLDEQPFVFEFEDVGVEPASIALRPGEIVGLAGVVGSGRNRVLSTLFGATGTARLGGERVRSPRHAIDSGMFLVPEDRKLAGLVLGLTVRENLTMAILPRLVAAGLFMNAPRERREALRWIERINLRPPEPEKPVGDLSGGNQQKVVVGKALATEPRILLLDEPTRGVDVGARSEIYGVIDDLAKEGMALLIASSDTDELVGLCDKILIFRKGRVTSTLERPLDEGEVVAHVTGARQVA